MELDEGSALEDGSAEDEEAPAPEDGLGRTPKSSSELPCCLLSMARYMCAGRR